jgi:hypothetical protein
MMLIECLSRWRQFTIRVRGRDITETEVLEVVARHETIVHPALEVGARLWAALA